MLPVSTLLTGEFGIDALYLSLPCILGAGGVERVLVPGLDEEEEAGLRASAQMLRDALAVLDGNSPAVA